MPQPIDVSDDRTVWERLIKVVGYFTKPRSAWIALTLSVIVGSALEPTIPALMKPLLDHGFGAPDLNYWLIPMAVIGLFSLRSSASFLADVALAKIAQTSLHSLRQKMFDCISVAELDLYRKQPATALANTVVFEATNGALLLLQSVTTLVKDSLSLAALVAYLLYLN